MVTIKTIYCMQRFFQDTNELFDILRFAVRSYGICENQQAVNQLMDIIKVAAFCS